ncbi:hypothetical protein [Mesorhizobium sp. CO1-1-8]|uniref:hypothetical protein n=1 Tax=Mesorhizobium sp. CO1-1-8 TaxID=2876631 RepID=UPI001CD09651|nr:hypothetical protein [Mesorhizobium sp. CO1-1-8]MBZ9776828.1 hypothetical protein [Mesorhizobium sp. CO1-1-8]
MTAEIAILNKSAVALAADSKVTFSRGGKQKTFDTVNKLFNLSKTEPVGAMIYGNAEFVGFPWETIIKEYRRQRQQAKFATVFDWADDLLKFLLTFFNFTAADEDATAISIAQSWIDQIVSQAYRSSRSPDEFSSSLDELIREYTETLENAPVFLSDDEWGQIDGRIGDQIGQHCSRGMMKNFAADQPKLKPIAELAIRRNLASPGCTGLVVAGFGDKELLPSIISFDIDGILARRLKYLEIQREDMTRKSSGVIIPFAQTDMVDRFMQGIDPSYAMLLHGSIGQLVFDSALNAARALGHTDDQIDALAPAFASARDAAIQTFWESHERHRRDRFANPIIEMVEGLPKDELANVAEALVSLTSLQRKVSRELETVGGAIDVAVISKGDGFIWIKRKHYFSADRNLRFVNAYFHDHNGVATSEEAK